jgi:hypothetical protein
MERTDIFDTDLVLKYAKSLEVICPSEFQRIHCWFCSKCEERKKCLSWRPLAAEVLFYQRSDPPLTLLLLMERKNAEKSQGSDQQT